MATQITDALWDHARKMYEDDGKSQKAIAEFLGCTTKTVQRRAREWTKAGTTATAAAHADSVEVTETVIIHDVGLTVTDIDAAGEITTSQAAELSQVTTENERLEARNAQLEARNAELEDERDRLDPTFDVSSWNWNSPEAVIEHFGEEALFDMAQMELRDINKERLSQGLGRVEATQASVIEQAKQLQAEHSARKGNSRTMKLVNPKGPHIVQVMLEDQVNNFGGSLYDATQRYIQKGFKFCKPALCGRIGCFVPAAIDVNGQFAYSGYCSEIDRQAVEGAYAIGTTNAITAAQGLGR